MWEIIQKLMNPESIIKLGGLVLLLIVIFAETGLMIGFFLPGDSLVFLSGLFCATDPRLLHINIFLLIAGMCIAAILGNMTGYWFGKRVGPALFKRDDTLLFKKKYLTTTRVFYRRYGGKTLILARFLPVIRTFAPILAGVIGVEFRQFMLYNFIGAVLWISSLSLIGYLLGDIYPGIKNYQGYIVIGLIIITSIPVLRTYLKERGK